MATFHKSEKFVGVVAILTALAWVNGRPGSLGAAEPGDDDFSAKAWQSKYQNANACSRCHTRPIAQDKADGSLDFVLLAESAIWKAYDKHAQAFASLLGKRSERMG